MKKELPEIHNIKQSNYPNLVLSLDTNVGTRGWLADLDNR